MKRIPLAILGVLLMGILYNADLVFPGRFTQAEPLPAKEAEKSEPISIKPMNSVEKAALEFIQSKMQTPDGIIYYSIQHVTKESYSVSESLGQAMEYTALIGDASLFNYYAQVTEKYFKDPKGYYYWRIDVNRNGKVTGKDTVSALVDDLRLVRAYFIAHKNYLGDYTSEIKRISDLILKFDFNDDYPCDYYNVAGNEKAKYVSLFYLDIETLKRLSQFDGNWIAPYKNTKDILLNIPDNKYGFYPKSFRTDKKEYTWQPTTNMVENLYTALYAFHAGKDTTPFLNFLKKEMKKGKINNHYHNSDGYPVNSDESTAVYALATRFFALHNESEAAKWAYGRTMDFRISEKNKFYGGFGDEESGLVYAFDQLEALLMLRMVQIGDDVQ